MKKTRLAWFGVAALACSGVAAAVPVYFDLASAPESSVTISNLNKTCVLTSCGLTASLNPNLGSLTNTLSAGQSWSFDFFSLNFYGLGAGSGTIAASLGFDAPSDAPTANGAGGGSFLSAFFFTAGNLTWSTQPGLFSLADGTSYTVRFQDLYGIKAGSIVNVKALLTLNTEPTSVPEPGALALLGLGLLGAGLSRRMRRHKTQA